eukprot:c241_g1_i1 orf=105-479(+)
MAGLWRRFKLWVRRRVERLVWRLVSSRLYRALRSLASASLLPLSSIAAGALTGLCIAAFAGLAIAYGALIGAGGAFIAFLVWKLGKKVVDRIRCQNMSRRRITFERHEKTSFFSRSSRSRRRGR